MEAESLQCLLLPHPPLSTRLGLAQWLSPVLLQRPPRWPNMPGTSLLLVHYHTEATAISKHKLSVGSLLSMRTSKSLGQHPRPATIWPPPLQPMTPHPPHSTLCTNLPFLLIGSLRQCEAASPAALPPLPAPRAVQLLSNRSTSPTAPMFAQHPVCFRITARLHCIYWFACLRPRARTQAYLLLNPQPGRGPST